ncbi:MAG: biotin/lipoate A/B protein ligase family protein [Haloferacaceae archaeon]
MRVVRGRGRTPAADQDVTAALLRRAAETGEAGLRVWRPHRQVAFGRRDAAADGYERARETARAAGFAPVERAVGGRAVAHTGETLVFGYAVGCDDPRSGIQSRYREATALLRRALDAVGVRARRGEPDGSFCPGQHSLQNGGKLAGLAQRVRREAALVGGCVTVRAADEREIAEVLGTVYAALDVPFDPASVGSVEGAGGDGDPVAVARAIEDAFGDAADAVSVVDADSLVSTDST